VGALKPAAIRTFAREYPEIKLNVREDLTHSLLAQLAEGDLDLALLSLPIERRDMAAEPLLTEEMVLAVPPLRVAGEKGRGR
jgi:LysR family transcriptional regulator, hydrogen peroxide-inducible genes activator